ncbi:hypothetical protein [Candidatus Cardinium hertigii]|uniref:Uncharacterized protein n=1 Tax=Candidatus Cardinium hertigii TaxID=247481 RepID=A0A2Z3LIT9_9BACT|nr:hypothetical protein [Candidatus Cardinium hertigii]AWN81970.1 hypothetical protein DK880_00656 [Candidatus Cardinium hertigii]
MDAIIGNGSVEAIHGTASIRTYYKGRLAFHILCIYLKPCNSTIGKACSKIDKDRNREIAIGKGFLFFN